MTTEGLNPEAIAAMEQTATEQIGDTPMADLSEERAKFFRQDVGGFEVYETDPRTGDRLLPTVEQRDRMDRELQELHELFDGADFPWRLDGGLNISIYTGEYIGNHKDIDVALPTTAAELEQVNDWLGARGYGLFLGEVNHEGGRTGRNVLERTDGAGFLRGKDQGRHFFIMAIDQRGAIRQDAVLSAIDIHVDTLDDEGRIQEHNGVLPVEWTKPQPRTFHGIELPASHPALTAYYKLHQTRAYDQRDLEKMVDCGALTGDDLVELGEIMSAERESVIERIDGILGGISDGIKPDMDLDTAVEVFSRHPEVAKNLQRGMDARVVRDAAQVMLDHQAEGRAGMIRATAEHLGLQARYHAWDRNMEQLRTYAEDRQST